MNVLVPCKYVGHSRSNAICSIFCVFLSDRDNLFSFRKFDSICIQENTHQLNRTIYLMLLSSHRMAEKVSLPRKPLFKNKINKREALVFL